MASAASASSQAALDNATRASTSSWQADLKVLFDNARDRFADVVWEFQPDPSKPSEEVWGHKAVVYARAPPAFQQRYFAFRPAPVSSPTPYSSSPIPPISSVSLGIDLADPSRSPSPYGMRGASPTPSAMPGTLMRLHPQIDVSLFTHELEYLYTGVGFGEAFEFLFDALDGADRPVLGGGADAEHLRVEKLRHDLNYMWRSRLYSDVRLSLTGNWSSTPSGVESSTALFSAHRFVLASRSNYFKNALSGGFAPLSSTNIGGPVTLTLPSPPFTPASLHFTLGYLYTGTLVFSHRTYDLDTAFAILRSASFLALGTLHNEVEARIVDEMMHGLNLAYVPFTTYETLTGGRWGVAGCKCRQCARRAPRVLAFALEPEVRNALLENGARRALGTLFGEGWVTQEFAALPPKLRSSLLSGLAKRAKGNGTQNVFALLHAVGAGLKRCDKEVADLGKKRVAVAAGKKSTKAEDLDDAWVATVREALIHARASIDEALCGSPAEAFEADDWLVLLEGDGVAFDDRERVEGVMASLVRGLTPTNAGIVYQTLVSSILLRPHPSDANTSLLDPSSALRSLIEDTRKEILGWLAKNKNWTKVRDAQGFDPLEEWARKEILDELELSSDDLTTPTSSTPARPITRTGLRPVMPRSGIDFDSASMASASTSLRRELGPGFDTDGTGTDPGTDRADTDSVHSTSTAGPHARALSPGGTTLRTRDKTTGANKAQAVAARRTGVSLTTPAGGSGTKSLAASVDGMSVGSGVGASGKKVVQASAAGPSTPAAPAAASGSGTGTGAPTRKLPPTPSPVPEKRPVSVASTAATRSSVYKTAAATTGVRSRTTSAASTSTVNTRNKAEGVSPNLAVNTTFLTPTVPRQRTTSAASASSVASARSAASAASRASVSATPKKAPVTRGAPTPSPTTKTGPARGSTATPSPIPTGKLGSASRPTTPKNTPKPGAAGTRQRAASTASTRSVRAGKEKEEKSTKPPVPALPKVPLRKPEPPTDADGDVFMEDPPSTASTVRLKRKGSNDTITFDSSGPSSSAGQAPPRPESIAERDEAHTRTLKARPIGLSKYFDEPTSSATAPNFPLPSGVTLNVGIPCIITSRRQRMKAFARYIGEVAGEAGPWIGVEVPIGASWGGERLDGRAWNDGSWGGVHYFDVGVDDYADMARSGASFRRGTKREGESLSIEAAKRMRSASPAMSDISTTESRGLFVRPQQVLYVVQSESAWRNDDS